MDGSGGHDAGPGTDGGAGTDATSSDGTAGNGVTVTYLNRGRPVSGASVVFSDSMGAILSTSMTDQQGHASASVPTGSMVTVVDQTQMNATAIQTITNVQATDQLTFGSRDLPAVTAGMVRAQIDSLFPGAAYTTLDMGCLVNRITQPHIGYDMPISSLCLDRSMLAAIVGIAHRIDGLPLAYALATDIAAPRGTTSSVTLGAWFTDFAQFKMHAANAPEGSVSLVTTIGLARNGGPLFTNEGAATDANPGQSIDVIALKPPSFGDKMTYSAAIRFGRSATAAVSSVEVVNAPVTTTITVDLGMALLGRVLSFAIDGTTPTKPAATWQAAQTPTGAPKAMAVQINWILLNGNMGAWAILLPAEASGTLHVPDLPASLAGALPTSGGSYSGGQIVFLDVSNGVTSYHDYATKIAFAKSPSGLTLPDGAQLRASFALQ
jgi:hypothetical protein